MIEQQQHKGTYTSVYLHYPILNYKEKIDPFMFNTSLSGSICVHELPLIVPVRLALYLRTCFSERPFQKESLSQACRLGVGAQLCSDGGGKWPPLHILLQTSLSLPYIEGHWLSIPGFATSPPVLRWNILICEDKYFFNPIGIQVGDFFFFTK